MGLTWDEFVAVHAPAVLQAATRIVRNPTDAEEVSQEVFIEIFRAGHFAALHTQPGLIRTIATRRSLDRLRRRKTVHELNGSEVSPQTFEPGDYAIAGELAAQLERELAGLPPREAEVFCLVYFEDYSYAEISQLLGISAGAVAKSLCRVRDRLSRAFGLSETETRR